ncbi:hypothetical protein KBD81_01380 [Candidatus Woesebacteria bacterium]|nr:hypothetical protein [Candidatus Woesebacteria bacterium]
MSSILSFLEKLNGSREIGLCITGIDPLNGAENMIVGDGFHLAHQPSDFTGEGSYVFVIDEDNAKSLYDFASEYTTGQVSFIDAEGNRSWITPVYEKSRVVFLTDKPTLQALDKQGIDILSVCGMTYQE